MFFIPTSLKSTVTTALFKKEFKRRAATHSSLWERPTFSCFWH